jgi:hypothetical protein
MIIKYSETELNSNVACYHQHPTNKTEHQEQGCNQLQLASIPVNAAICCASQPEWLKQNVERVDRSEQF